MEGRDTFCSQLCRMLWVYFYEIALIHDMYGNPTHTCTHTCTHTHTYSHTHLPCASLIFSHFYNVSASVIG